MAGSTGLQHYLVDSARRAPAQVAVVEPGLAEIRYADLDSLTDALRDHLVAIGVQPGDRVGLALRTSVIFQSWRPA